MTTVADILNYIESIAPPYMAESWDNVGLLCGRKGREVRKILVALDPFATVIDEAIDEKCDQNLFHFPVFAAAEQTHVVPALHHIRRGNGFDVLQNISYGCHRCVPPF